MPSSQLNATCGLTSGRRQSLIASTERRSATRGESVQSSTGVTHGQVSASRLGSREHSASGSVKRLPRASLAATKWSETRHATVSAYLTTSLSPYSVKSDPQVFLFDHTDDEGIPTVTVRRPTGLSASQESRTPSTDRADHIPRDSESQLSADSTQHHHYQNKQQIWKEGRR